MPRPFSSRLLAVAALQSVFANAVQVGERLVAMRPKGPRLPGNYPPEPGHTNGKCRDRHPQKKCHRSHKARVSHPSSHHFARYQKRAAGRARRAHQLRVMETLAHA